MKTISELINKIKWDEKEDPEEYSLFYEDRISHDYKEIKFLAIKK